MPVQLSTLSELNDFASKNTYVLIDFWATWCPPCRAIAPVFEQMSKSNSVDNKFAFAKVDVDQSPDIARQYNITAMPTFILLKNGEIQKESTILGVDPRRIAALVESVKADLKKAEDVDNVKKEAASEVPKEDVPTVSGSYTMSSNPSWRMAL